MAEVIPFEPWQIASINSQIHMLLNVYDRDQLILLEDMGKIPNYIRTPRAFERL